MTFEARAAYDGVYRSGSWMPILVTAQNDGTDIVAQVEVGAGSDRTTYATMLDLPGGARKSVTVYAYMPGFMRRLVVRLTHDGQQLAQQPVNVTPRSSDAYFIGVVTSDGVQIRLPDQLASKALLTTIPLRLQDLPDQVHGLVMFDALVLNDVPTEELRDDQRAVLQEWVARGGQLVLAGGAGAQRTLKGLPELLRPVNYIDLQQVAARDLLGLADNDAGELTIAHVEPVAATDQESPIYPLVTGILNEAAPDFNNTPVLIERALGNGAVTFFAASFDASAFVNWPGQQTFWSEILHQRQMLAPGFGPAGIRSDTFVEGNIATALTELPALEFPSLLLMGSLLLVYVLLIGPVTYFVLRLFDRQLLGWAVVPVITIVFAVIAYGLGFAQRGGDVIVNQITWIEPLVTDTGGSGLARVRSFAGIFSPSEENYTLDISSPRPAATMPLLRPISLLGPWDGNEGAQGGVFVQDDGSLSSTHVTDLEVAKWSMRAVLADTVQAYQGVSAQITMDGTSLIGEIYNGGAQPVDDVAMVQGGQVAWFGRIEPGEHRRAELMRKPNGTSGGHFFESSSLGYLLYGDQMGTFNRPDSGPPPRDLLLRIRLLDALYNTGPTMRNTHPVLVAWMDAASLDVNIPDQRVAHQQLTLITLTPQLRVAGDSISLDRGWMERRVEQHSDSMCMGSQGLGVNLYNTQSAVVTLSLPRELSTLQASKLSLLTSADGPWPQEVQVALFDWQTGTWIDQERTGSTIAITEPKRFMSGNGALRVQVGGQVVPQNLPGCMYVDATVEGVLP
ncbi:MAG: hypothetical protein MI924_19330 [Chloroflexales bacterium]|nr:hypothetical protein [Chloroflexales bacterium]